MSCFRIHGLNNLYLYRPFFTPRPRCTYFGTFYIVGIVKPLGITIQAITIIDILQYLKISVQRVRHVWGLRSQPPGEQLFSDLTSCLITGRYLLISSAMCASQNSTCHFVCPPKVQIPYLLPAFYKHNKRNFSSQEKHCFCCNYERWKKNIFFVEVRMLI